MLCCQRVTDSDEDSEDDDRPADNVADMFKKTEPVVTKKPEPKADDVSSFFLLPYNVCIHL